MDQSDQITSCIATIYAPNIMTFEADFFLLCFTYVHI